MNLWWCVCVSVCANKTYQFCWLVVAILLHWCIVCCFFVYGIFLLFLCLCHDHWSFWFVGCAAHAVAAKALSDKLHSLWCSTKMRTKRQHLLSWTQAKDQADLTDVINLDSSGLLKSVDFFSSLLIYLSFMESKQDQLILFSKKRTMCVFKVCLILLQIKECISSVSKHQSEVTDGIKFGELNSVQTCGLFPIFSPHWWNWIQISQAASWLVLLHLVLYMFGKTINSSLFGFSGVVSISNICCLSGLVACSCGHDK